MADGPMCTEVSPACPVEATTYGYYPVFWANVALCAAFGLLGVLQLLLGALTRVRAYSAVLACGCLLECVGYVGRLLMRRNPWDPAGIKMQIVCLIIAPSFTAAGVYLTLKHTVTHNGPQHSRLRPNLYTWVFVGCDLGSICLQAIGGGVAASASDTGSADMLHAGNDIIIAGIAFQVATMLACGLLAAEFIVKLVRHRRASNIRAVSAQEKSGDVKAQTFQFAVMFAYLLILIRCIYRIPEMAGGWGNPRMRNEQDFLILDGLMIVLASAALTLFHPGFFYPQMRSKPKNK
ncbi:hypothetical protein SLS62_002432 [Diatrype stigma]|uniref:Sphingoid long-chain base transporter RSB1 n=1 Tax=Diatrype stigma TaxID=117547 RepID=A0AAN9V062_9PEZI